MVKIEAIVRPERINLVVNAVEDAGCPGYHLYNVNGKGRQKGVEVFTGRGTGTAVRTSLPKTLLVTVVADDMQEAIVSAIIESARATLYCMSSESPTHFPVQHVPPNSTQERIMAQHEGISRRGFLARSSAGVSGVAGLYATHRSASDAAAAVAAARADRLPREVWAASMGQMNLHANAKDPRDVCNAMIARMEEALPMRPFHQ